MCLDYRKMISSQAASKKKLPLMLFPPLVSKPFFQRELLPMPMPAPAPAPTNAFSLNVMKDGPAQKKTNRRGGKRGGRAKKMTFTNVIDIDGISKYAKNQSAPSLSLSPSLSPAPVSAPAPPSIQHTSPLSMPPPSPFAPLQKKFVSSWAKLAPSYQIDESEICLPLPFMPEGFNSQVSALDANKNFKEQLRSVNLSVSLLM